MVNWDRVNAINYESKAFIDAHWFNVAKNLLVSANLLKPKINDVWQSVEDDSVDTTTRVLADYYTGVYFMLLGYAVENLFKGAIVQKKSLNFRKQFKEKKKFPKELRGHDLVLLAKKANFIFTRDDEELLRRLTRSAVWYGRYPVPLYYRDINASQTFSDGSSFSVSWFGSSDIERLDDLVERIKSQFEHITG